MQALELSIHPMLFLARCVYFDSSISGGKDSPGVGEENKIAS